jgi:hypothetical protein
MMMEKDPGRAESRARGGNLSFQNLAILEVAV